MENYKQVVYNGEPIDGYWIARDGSIWSSKQTKFKRLAESIAGGTPYPKVALMYRGKIKSFSVHRLVCEAYHKFPLPNGVTKTVWAQTHVSVKKLLSSLYQVNHIDHNHLNFHPSNLEWVTAKENQQKYQTHRQTK
jgi:hypothetical protein